MVDFEPASLNKTMLFLMSKSDSLRQVEVYLRKREWDVVITTSLKEAIINVIQLKPSYFFISYDFPNKKALALSKALEHQTSVIITGEIAKPHTLKAIQDYKAKYKLPPPVTGPAIERIINRITRDIQNQDAEIQESIKKGTVTKEQESIIKIRSSFKNGAGGDSMIQAGGGIGTLLSAFGEDTGPSYSQSQFDYNDGGSSRLGGGDEDDLSQDARAAHEMFEQAAAMHGASGEDVDPPELGLAELSKMNAKDFAEALDKLRKKKKASADGAQSEGFDEELAKQVETDFEKLKRSAMARRQRRYQGAEYGGDAAKKKAPRYRQEKNANSEAMTLLESGTHQAVDQTVLSSEEEQESVEFKKTSRVACIFVESIRFNGYLLVAFASDRQVDLKLIEQMKGKLFSYLKDNGEKSVDSESLSLKMTEVEFEDWALEHAEFLKSTEHEGQEIAVAFFPANSKFAELQEQTKLKKYELSIDELRGDLVVEFDLYLHLEVNNKLLLYTPQGRPFYSNQKDRLKTKGISNLYINQESKNDLKKYRVQNYLNDKIAEFKKKKSEKDH